MLNPCSYYLILHTGVVSGCICGDHIWPRGGERHVLAGRAGGGALPVRASRRSIIGASPCTRTLRAHFTETEVAEIAAVVINMNVWTRLKLAQGAVPVPPECPPVRPVGAALDANPGDQP